MVSKHARVPAMVRIPGGCFDMGSPPNEASRDSSERQHQVCVKPFWLGKYEVTFDEYDRFCQATGREKPLKKLACAEARPGARPVSFG